MGSGVGDFGWRACRGPRAGVLKDLGLAAEVEAEGAIGRVWLLPAGYRRRTGGAILAHRLDPGTGRDDTLRHVEPDFAPLVDQPGRDIFVGLVDVAVQQLEAEAIGPRLLQQPPRLGPRFLDVGPEPGNLPQLRSGRRQRRAGKDEAADGVHNGDRGERRANGRSRGSVRGAAEGRRTEASGGLASPGWQCSNRSLGP